MRCDRPKIRLAIRTACKHAPASARISTIEIVYYFNKMVINTYMNILLRLSKDLWHIFGNLFCSVLLATVALYTANIDMQRKPNSVL